MRRNIIFTFLIAFVLLPEHSHGVAKQPSFDKNIEALRKLLASQNYTSKSQKKNKNKKIVIIEKPDLTQIKEVTSDIGDVRTRLYSDFSRHYVQERGTHFSFNSPEGLYTKYKDMILDAEGNDFSETLPHFYEGMQHEHGKIEALVQKIGPQLVTCASLVDKSKHARQKVNKLLGDWMTVQADQRDIKEHIGFNHFIQKMERLDVMLETSRQVFMALVQHYEPPKTRPSKMNKLKAKR